MNDSEQPDGATCDRCGKDAAGHMGEEALCESCYHAESSCCGRFCEDTNDFQ